MKERAQINVKCTLNLSSRGRCQVSNIPDSVTVAHRSTLFRRMTAASSSAGEQILVRRRMLSDDTTKESECFIIF